MKPLRLTFAIVAVLFLVVLAVSPLKDYLREWKHDQIEYNRLVAGLPQRVKPVDIGIRQVWVQKLDRVDRCVTCHLGVKEPALHAAPEPFRTHPRIYHDVDDLGCTFCHEGRDLRPNTGSPSARSNTGTGRSSPAPTWKRPAPNATGKRMSPRRRF